MLLRILLPAALSVGLIASPALAAPPREEQPRAAEDPGWRLSFAAVVGILGLIALILLILLLLGRL